MVSSNKEKEEANIAVGTTLRVSPAAQTWTKSFPKVSKPELPLRNIRLIKIFHSGKR
jgi:hypothetical protein